MRISLVGSCIFWFLGFVLLSYNTGFSSSMERDSLEQLLPGSHGEARLSILNDLVDIYNREAPSIAEQKAREALTFSRAIQSENGYPRALRNLGSYHYFQSGYDSSVYYHRIALANVNGKAKETVLEKAKIMNGLGVTFDVIGQQDSALHYLMEALSINESQNSLNGISNTLSNIAYFYSFQGNDEEAMRYFHKCLEIDRKINKLNLVAMDLSNIGAIHSNRGEYKKALEMHQKALKIRKELGVPAEIARSLNNMSLAYNALGDTKTALAMAEEALSIKRQMNDGYELVQTLTNLAQIYRESEGDYSTAEKHLLEARTIADTLGLVNLKILTNNALAKTYDKMGAYKKAYETEKKLRQIELDSKTAAKDRRIEELMAEFDAMDKKSQLNSLRLQQEIDTEKIERSSQRVFFLRLGILVCFILMLMVTILFLQKRKSNVNLRSLNQRLEDRNQQIAEKNNEIQEKSALLGKKNQEILEINANLEDIVDERTLNLKATNKELDTFVYQTSHALRAPLMRVMGLFSIIRDSNDEVTRSTMQAKIDATIGGMDRMLYKLLDVQEIKLRSLEPALIDLAQTIQEIIHEIKDKSTLPPPTWELDLPDNKVMVGDRFVLRSILLNLIENAYHFRHQDRLNDHKIQVKVNQLTDHELMISIADNGMGIPEQEIGKTFDMFYRGTYKSQGTGLGLYVVHKSLEKIGGKIELDSKEGIGTTFKLALPLPQPVI